MGKAVEFKVVGMTFVPGYPQTMYDISALAEERQRAGLGWTGDSAGPDGPLPVVLIRNPENPVDPDAIQVHVPALGRNAMVGHVPASTGLAKKLAASIDRGDEWKAYLDRVLIHPDHPDNPGIMVVVECLSRAAAPVQ